MIHYQKPINNKFNKNSQNSNKYATNEGFPWIVPYSFSLSKFLINFYPSFNTISSKGYTYKGGP